MSENNRRQDFTEGSIPRHLIRFSVPMFIGNALQALYNTVDSIWVGQFLGTGGLAAVSVSFPILFALVALAMGIGMATTTLVAQYSGAKDHQMVKRTISNSLILTVIMGILSGAAGVFLRRPLLNLINTPSEILEMAESYLGVIMAGIGALFMYNIISAIMRGFGDSRTPLIFLAYATVLNMILDPLLIFGLGPFPKMGVAGAALATVIAQSVSGILGIRHMLRIGLLSRDRRDWHLERRLVGLTFSIGLPAGIQQVIVSMGMLTLTSLVNSFGAVTTAAFGVGARLDQFAFMPSMTVGLSVTALVGQNLGARKFDRVREVIRWAAILTVGITGTVSAITLSIPQILLRIFTSNPEVLIEGTKYLRIVALSYVPSSLMFMLSGILRGAGDTFPSMIISIVTLWVIRIPLAVYFSRVVGNTGIWIGLALSPVVGASLNWLYYASGRWQRRNITGLVGSSKGQRSPLTDTSDR